MPLLKVLGAVRPRSLVIAAAVINSAHALGFAADMVITSGNDSTHMFGSKHYTDEALDFRTHTLTVKERAQLVDMTRTRLGPKYQVLLEPDHLHIEYDPQ